MNRLFIAVFTSLSLLASARGAVNITEQVGTGHAWVADNAWQSVMGLNDSFNSLGATDFVGNVSNPGFYMASTNDYLYFRMRVAYTGVATLATFRETHMVLLNVVGYNYTTGISGTNDGTLPDFALA